MQPSREAAIAADETVRDLQRDKKDKSSGPGRSAVVRAALAKEPTDQLKSLLETDDKTLVTYVVTVLADAFCISDPRETLESYDLKGWTTRKTDMPHVEQVRGWIGTELDDRRDA